jgi:hypothetical protein
LSPPAGVCQQGDLHDQHKLGGIELERYERLSRNFRDAKHPGTESGIVFRQHLEAYGK